MQEFYTVNELSEKLKYSRSTIYRWVEEGSISCHYFGRQVRFTEQDVADIIYQKVADSRKKQQQDYHRPGFSGY
jgi:excisionase family DNA binding protein